MPVQERIYRSLKLWSLYVDLEESLGTVESTKAVYEKVRGTDRARGGDGAEPGMKPVSWRSFYPLPARSF
jgi:hypothetical protein